LPERDNANNPGAPGPSPRASRRKFLAAGGVSLATACSWFGDKKRPPNVLYLFSDQQQARTVSAYGGALVRTPSIDRIAAGGCRFDNAISTVPVCSPYRAMLMSGLYPMRNGVVANDTPISDGLPVLGKMFRDAGYRTGYIGKWHLEATRRGFVPPQRRQGFDFWAAHSCNHKHFDSPYYRDDPNQELIHHGYEPDSQTTIASDFIREAASGEQPFCLMLSFGPPHPPYRAPAAYESRFQPESEIPLPPNVNEHRIVNDLLRTDCRPLTMRQLEARGGYRALLADDERIRAEVLRGYYGACEALDACVGRLLDLLDELNLTGNTIVVYTSDHGDLAGSHRMISKQNPLEESIRVPFLIRYPGAVPAGSATDTLLAPIDILPTLLSLSSIAYDPAQYDGIDITGAAFRGASSPRKALLISKMTPGGNPWVANGIRPWRGLRTPHHTYAELEGQPWLLFNNREDPYQQNNLIFDPLRTGLRSWFHSQMRELQEEAGDTLAEAEIEQFRKQQIDTYG